MKLLSSTRQPNPEAAVSYTTRKSAAVCRASHILNAAPMPTACLLLVPGEHDRLCVDRVYLIAQGACNERARLLQLHSHQLHGGCGHKHVSLSCDCNCDDDNF